MKWDQYKDVEPVVLDGFKSAMSSAISVPGRPVSRTCVMLEPCTVADDHVLVMHSSGQPNLHRHCPVQVSNFASAEFSLWPAELKIPKFDVTEHVKKVDTDFDPLLKSATELEAFSQKRQKEIEEEIKQIDVEIVSSSSMPLLDSQQHVAGSS